MADMELVRGDFDRTRNHWWWRPGWSMGARYITIHLTFAEAPEVRDAVEPYAEALDGIAGVDRVPPEWLHLTMTGVGFADELERTAVAEVATRVLSDVLPLGPLVFDTMFLGSEGLSLMGPDQHWLVELKARQERLVRELVPGATFATFFHPHVSLAYFSGEIDERALVDAVRAVGLVDVQVRTPTLSVLELGRDDRVYTWLTLAERTLVLPS